MLTIAPSPRRSIADTAARVARSAAKKLSSNEASKSASLVARNPSRRSLTPPTLFTSTSRRPWPSTALPTSCAGPSGWTRSPATGVTRSIPSSSSTVRAPAKTCAPSAASMRVTARPIPLLAPVTTAIFPFSSRSNVLLVALPSCRIDHERDLVHVTPAPVLTGLRGARDRMAVLARVLGRVPVRRRVAAADLPAGLAHAQVHPAGADLQALLAAGDRLGQGRVLDLVEVAADAHANRRTKASAVSATSRQPLSMVSACPRPFIFTISVAPSFFCCFL